MCCAACLCVWAGLLMWQHLYTHLYVLEQLVSNNLLWRDVGYQKEVKLQFEFHNGFCLFCRRQPVHMLQFIRQKSTCKRVPLLQYTLCTEAIVAILIEVFSAFFLITAQHCTLSYVVSSCTFSFLTVTLSTRREHLTSTCVKCYPAVFPFIPSLVWLNSLRLLSWSKQRLQVRRPVNSDGTCRRPNRPCSSAQATTRLDHVRMCVGTCVWLSTVRSNA